MTSPLTRRHFLASTAGVLAAASGRAAATVPKKVAAVVTVFTHNSHAEMIAGRLLESYTLDGKGERPNLQLVSLSTDQVPEADLSRALAKKHGFLLAPTIAEALTLGGKDLAV